MRTRAHKYGAKPKVVEGIRFTSTAEARRYSELRLLEKAGEIRGLEVQPVYVLWAKDTRTGEAVKVGQYRGDFRYYDAREGRSVTEDVKGVRTQIYVLKRKIVEANYGITITEVA